MNEDREYRVYWVIDVSAKSYEAAARQARWMQQNPDSTATCFAVHLLDRPGATPVLVDLSEIDGST
jgi:hypothetical protein